jgi:hypothetical protein
MTLESTNVPSLENQSIKSVKDGTAASIRNPTAIDDVIRDTWSKKNVRADVASGSPNSTELVMSPIFDFGVSGKKSAETRGVKMFTEPEATEKQKKFGIVADGASFVTLDGALAKTGDFKIKSNADDPNSAVERAITAAQAEAAQRVLNNPQWENNFIRSIGASDRAMRAHPNLADEIDQARTSVTQRKEDLLAKEKKIDNMINDLKPSEMKYVNHLVNSEPGSKQRDTLLKLYPEIYQQVIERDSMNNRSENANRDCRDLQRISDTAVRSRLDYASFLNRRGASGDSREMAHQLADIARIDPNIVNPYADHPQFHDVRDLARNLDKKSQGIFEEALSQQRIQYDTYFSPKFDRNYSKKVSDNMLPEQGIHFGPLKKSLESKLDHQ